ncbi:hypothetical protein B0H15DRAFT_792677 [Mycena belliarum]|uniref:Uncharacterized protein n=1 Tax=Mycena belliarum TaxID=1033014 RepID=A0AAD6XLX9_9AGAR|nr:hypothetical protein B0H15DRAFT_792677 [Mycena belliae]
MAHGGLPSDDISLPRTVVQVQFPQIISVFITLDKFGSRKFLISTLNPSLITPADYMDVSGMACFNFRYSGSITGVGDPEARRPGLSYVPQDGRFIRFPDKTHGFLYYHSQPHISPLAGSVRFRVTQDNAPFSFTGGHDLLTPSGVPWQIILPQIACRPVYAWLPQHLLRDRLVTEDLLSRCRDVFRERERMQPFSIVFTFDSTFLVNFSSETALTIAGDTLHRLRLDIFKMGIRDYPWTGTHGLGLYSQCTGSALARFEASTLPEYAGRRMIHLRVIKVLEPVSPLVDLQTYRGRIQEPREGELFTVSHYGRLPKPWAYDIDASNSRAAALRALWDYSRTT